MVGGFFAINGGPLGEERGKVYDFAQDSLEWETLEMGYTDFLVWCFTGDLEKFYQDYRWPGWQVEVQALGGDQAFCIAPPPFTAGPSFGERPRCKVPLDELYRLYVGEPDE